jgi:hypothetical protein
MEVVPVEQVAAALGATLRNEAMPVAAPDG